MSQIAVTKDLRDKAEIIRGYLCGARGGALFLSAADAEILIDWLKSGIPPAAIMTAIDRLAKKRQSKLTRRRFTLKACKGELSKLLKVKKKPPQTVQHQGISGLVTQLKGMDTDAALREAKLELMAKLIDIAGESEDREKTATQAIEACQTFQDIAWQHAQANTEELLMHAEAELAPLKDMLGAALYNDALKEHMRNAVRSRYPLCTAQAVWTAMNAVKGD